MYKSDYNLLFWGFFLVIFNFRIQDFDILPDVIGYPLIIQALQGLRRQHHEYGKGIAFARVLAVWSLINIVQVQTGIQAPRPASFVDYAFLLVGQIGVILQMFLVYWILRTMIELAKESGNLLLNSQAMFRWKFYFWLSVVLLLTGPFAINLPEPIFLVMAVPIMLQFIAMLLLMVLISKAKRELSDCEAEG